MVRLLKHALIPAFISMPRQSVEEAEEEECLATDIQIDSACSLKCRLKKEEAVQKLHCWVSAAA